MKRIIAPLIISLFSIIAILMVANNFIKYDQNIRINITAKILIDDWPRIFYKATGEKYNETKCQSVHIKGSPEIQEFNLIIPYDKNLEEIRLDISGNKDQEPITLKSLTISTGNRELNVSIPESLICNEYIQYQNGKYHTKISHTARYLYDPYLIFDSSIVKFIKKKDYFINFSKWINTFLIALIFGATLFVYTYSKSLSFKDIISHLYIFIFIVILLTPSIVKILSLEPKNKNTENRKLAPKPKLRFDATYPSEFEAYYNDNFGLRNSIINYTSILKVKYLKVSTNSKTVQIGDDGYLFYNAFNTNTTAYNISQPILDSILNKQIELKNNYQNNGIKYIAGYWPNKHTVYPEYLPSLMRDIAAKSCNYSNNISNYLEKNGIVFFNVSESLINNKGKDHLYYKLDTHWNANGTYLAYKEFCKQTFNDLHITPFDKDEFSITYRHVLKGDLTVMLGIEEIDYFFDDRPNYVLKDKTKNFKLEPTDGYPKGTYITTNTECNNNDTLLVYCDSYSNMFRTFLSLHFRKVIYIWTYPFSSHPFDIKEVEKKSNPTIVLNCCVERFLPDLLKWKE